MAKTTYLAIPEGLEEFYFKALQPADRFVIARIRVKNPILSKYQKTKIKEKSLLPIIKEIWNSFSEAEKEAWKNIDYHTKKHGWRSFVADQTQRLLLGLEGTATPNIYHQDLVGKILIEAPAKEIKLEQPHPRAYWVAKKIINKKSMYEPVLITEDFELPLKIGLSFKSNLEEAGDNPEIKFYATIWSSYQGRDIYTNLEIKMPLKSESYYGTIYLGLNKFGSGVDESKGWDRFEKTISSVIGYTIAYNVYIHLKDVRGEFYFDNVLIEHSGQNWARDIYCKKVEQSFTRGFYQVPKHWAPIIMPEGAIYGSVYPTE
jgi:hypothetical protein